MEYLSYFEKKAVWHWALDIDIARLGRLT